jgi:inorganic pyrophosphatase
MRSTQNYLKFMLCLVLVFSEGVCAKTGTELVEASAVAEVRGLQQTGNFTRLSPVQVGERINSNVGENTVRVLVEIPVSSMQGNVPVLDHETCPRPEEEVSQRSVLRDAKELSRISEYTLLSSIHLVDDIDPIVGKNSVKVVIEIPTGSTQKWEVEKPSGDLKWEFKHGQPRTVQYLGYPGNYGMVPRTLLSEDDGGDGDPLDVLVLGPAVPRGSVVEVKIIGLLRMLDKGEDDDKIIAVMTDGVFAKVDDIDDLDEEFPGVTAIVETWFTNYKGQEKIETDGYVGRKKANKLLARALDDYKEHSK